MEEIAKQLREIKKNKTVSIIYSNKEGKHSKKKKKQVTLYYNITLGYF